MCECTCPTVLLDITQMSAGFSMATMILAAISSFSQVFFRLKSGVPTEQDKRWVTSSAGADNFSPSNTVLWVSAFTGLEW